MFARALLTLTVAAVVAAPGQAHAVNEYHLLALQMDANVRAYEESLVTYGQHYGDSFSSRSSWVDLRPMRTGAASRPSSARLLTARTAGVIKRTPLPFRPTTRVGGLGAQISGSSSPVSLGRIISGGTSSGGTPSFGALHEGGESFSFSRP